MKSLAVVLCLFGILLSIANADILHVPGDYPTIQAALVYAGTGDTILVAPGTYYEHIVWPSTQGINLLSEHGADSTIINALGTLRVLTINTNVDSTTVISGFTITNGSADDFGGGIYCHGASPLITNNIIINNSASGGGGICCDGCSPIISQNKIINNTATGIGVGCGGGGILCWVFCDSLKIVDNIITNNSADNDEGGGILGVASYQLIITGNTITDNSASLGGGMFIVKSLIIIKYNTVSNNTATNGGDGIDFSQAGGDVNYNNIFDNGYGMSKLSPPAINAEYNWWGDSTGPYNATLNPKGLGDTVSDNIDFKPWLYEPYGIEEYEISQDVFICLQVSPNPFTVKTDIRWQIENIEMQDVRSKMQDFTLKIYDVSGRIVRFFDLASGLSPLASTISWNGTDNSGNVVPSGVYFLKLETGDYRETKKLLRLR